MDKVRVAVIGCGHVGKWHVQKAILLPEAQLVAIVEKGKEGLARARKLYPGQRVVGELEDIVDDIDAAIVTTPTVTHFEIVCWLLERGKHVFCEKPLSSKLTQAIEIEQKATKHGRIVQVGHSERFHRAWSEREKYPQFFKKPGTVRINRMAPFKGRAMDVDVVQDLMIHDLDLLCYLFDEVPVVVHSIGHKIRTQKWDYVTSKFSFCSGREAFITVARNHIKEVREFEITNKSGCLLIDLLNSEFHIASAAATSEHGFVKMDRYSPSDHLLREQECFYKSIIHGAPVVVGVRDGVLAVKLVEQVLYGLEHDCEARIEE